MKTLALFSCLLLASNLSAQFSFQTPDGYLVDDNPSTMTVGDFDEDGYIDIVTGNTDTNTENLSILINDQSGGFNDRTDISLANAPYEVIATDMNGDNHLDLLVTINQNDEVAVLLGDGAGNFGSPNYFSTGTDTTPYGLVAGNFNSDAFPDIITANRDGDNISILFGDGSGSFSVPSLINVGNSPWDIVSGLFDDDAHLDIAVVNTLDDNLVVLLGAGDGTFPNSNTIENFFASEIELADLNGDGEWDITGNSSSTFMTTIGDGLGGFAAPINYNFCNGPGHTGDIDGDGNDDAVFETRDFAIYTMKGDGSGSLNYDVKYYTGIGTESTQVVDIDNDSDLDIVIAGSTGSSPFDQIVLILKNDGSGFFNSPIQYPILPLENNYEGAYAIVKGDFNEDGEMDLAATNHEDDQLVLIFGNSFGRFSLPVAIDTGDDPRDLLAGDFNKDDHLDLITLNWTSDNMRLHLGDGAGNFTSGSNFPITSTSLNFDTADFNNDDHLDLVVAGGSGNNFGFFAGNGSGGFSAPAYTDLTSTVYDVRALDADEDGNMDLAVSQSSLGEVVVFLGDGNGGFTNNGNYDTGNANWLELGDVNVDGHVDIAVSNSNNILLGAGDGSFTIQSITGIGGTTHFLIEDMDVDGQPDIVRTTQSVSSSFGPGIVTVYSLNESLVISDSWDQGEGSLGGFKAVIHDFNHDGLPDVATTDVNYNGIWILLNATNATCNEPSITSTSGNPPDLCVGESTTLTVTAEGDALEYQWSKDGTPISGQASNSFTVNTSNESDAGIYSVEVTNSCGSESVAFTVDVNEILSPPTASDNSGCTSEPIILTASGGSNGNYRWYDVATGGTSIAGEVNATYTTPALTSTASYYVSIINGACESSRTEVIATVISPPTITTQPSDQTIDEGASVDFSISASGQNLSYQWQKDGSDILGETSNTFQLTSVQPSDEGIYTCNVTNDCGAVTSSEANLTVNDTSNPLNVSDNVDQLLIYPNPATRHFTLRLPNEAGDSYFVQISDLSGKQVFSKNVESGTEELLIETNGMVEGTYLINVLSDSKLIASSTLIIQ